MKGDEISGFEGKPVIFADSIKPAEGQGSGETSPR
jgi:hypothetical protein